MLGLAGSTHGGVAASFPPASTANQHGSSNTAVSPTEGVFTPRGMRISSTISSALGGIMGSAAPTPTAASASMGDIRENMAVGQGTTVRRSITEQSDSTRSSLSLTGQGSTAGVGGATDQGATSPFAAGEGSGLTAPRPIAVGASGANAGGAAGAGSYFSSAQSPGASGAPIGAAAGALAQDDPAVWASGHEGRQCDANQPDAEPASPGLRGLVTRPELALCLLTEVRSIQEVSLLRSCHTARNVKA